MTWPPLIQQMVREVWMHQSGLNEIDQRCAIVNAHTHDARIDNCGKNVGDAIANTLSVANAQANRYVSR